MNVGRLGYAQLFCRELKFELWDQTTMKPHTVGTSIMCCTYSVLICFGIFYVFP